jgi:RND family efflux transporter MFP subunit
MFARLSGSIFLGIALVSGATGCRPTTPATTPQGPLPVNVVTAIEKEVVEWDEFTGRTEAVESVEVRPRVTGYLTKVHFEEGKEVKKGDPLFTIDPRPYQADFERTTAEVERNEAQMKLAEIDFKRAQELRAKNISSAEEFDQKSAAFRQTEAAVRAAKAAKDAAALNLEFTEIKSPIDGRVSNARVTVGNLVQSGAGADNVLTTVVSIDPIYVYIDADENSILKYLKLRDEGRRKSAREATIPAFIQLANETGFPHEGVIDFVDNRLDASTGTLRARAVFKSWNEFITPGFFVRMRIPGGDKSNAVLIPDSVISSQQGVKYVYVVKADKTIERRNLETGTIAEGMRIVRAGLKAGEQVVATRLQMLQPGMPVQPVPAEGGR